MYAKKVADSLGMGCDFTYGTLWPFSDVKLPAGDETRTYFDSVEVAKRPYTWDHPEMARILNHLDKEAFLRYADRMNQGLSEAYKGSKSGLFVDSWEVETDYLWTPGFGETFLEEHGYDHQQEIRLTDFGQGEKALLTALVYPHAEVYATISGEENYEIAANVAVIPSNLHLQRT